MEDAEKKKDNIVELKDGEVVIDQSTLTKVLEGQASLEKALEDERAARAGLEALINDKTGPDGDGGKKLRERKNFEPAFRTVTIKKWSPDGDPEKFKYVVGWTNRGAHQKVNREGVAPVVVDYIDIVLLGDERTDEQKLKAYEVPLLALINAPEVQCKVLETKDYAGKPFRLTYPPTGFGEKKMPTGEEIAVTTFDPKHGLVQTGDMIDGWVGYTDLTLVIQIPGVEEPVEIDAKYVNI